MVSEKKKPVLITHDEKQIFDSQRVWVIRDIKKCPEVINYLVYSSMFDLIRDKGYLFFSNENAANEYKFMNEKIFSRNDLKEMKNG